MGNLQLGNIWIAIFFDVSAWRFSLPQPELGLLWVVWNGYIYLKWRRNGTRKSRNIIKTILIFYACKWAVVAVRHHITFMRRLVFIKLVCVLLRRKSEGLLCIRISSSDMLYSFFFLILELIMMLCQCQGVVIFIHVYRACLSNNCTIEIYQ